MLPAEILAWNRTEAEYPRHKTIGQLFEEQVDRTPDAIALIVGERSFSYRELDGRANQLARQLRSCGVEPETLVGVAIERSHEMVVALLATLKAGGAYVPIDPGYPRQRIAHVLDDAQTSVLLTTSRNHPQMPEVSTCIVADGGEAGPIAAQSTERMASSVASHNLAYVLYTSGSAGKPKGVMVEHRNVVNLFTGMDRAIGSDPGVWLALTSMAFDISVVELFWTLTRGFTVVLHGDEGTHTIAAELKRHQVTHLQSVPSLARMLLMDTRAADALSSLKKLILGGEALTASLVTQLRQFMRGEIYNGYGPTETTIYSTIYRIEEHSTTIPIGRPIANTQIYLLDSERKPVPLGEQGMLYIGGDGVARGYLHQQRLTAERFLPDPFFAGRRIYNTGDLARFLPNGNIEYLGRADFQVKIRGFRIELGEIEAILEQHPAVHQAVVVTREYKPGDQRLVAYVVTKPALIGKLTGLELRSALEKKLPDFMVPAAFVFLESLPLTSSGKIDRNALPTPPSAGSSGAAAESLREQPRNEIERVIEQVWKEVLGVDNISLNENFFDLGAHSLLVAEVQVQLQQRLGREIPLVDLFHFPCVAALASHLNGESVPRRSPGSYRAQQRRAARQDRAPK
ncbi:MAG: non-ribosomal peptide synthetase [Candidatus Acidiferrales bacterium]